MAGMCVQTVAMLAHAHAFTSLSCVHGTVWCPGLPVMGQHAGIGVQMRMEMHQPMQVYVSANTFDFSRCVVFEDHRMVQQTMSGVTSGGHDRALD